MNKYNWKIKEPVSPELADKFPELNPVVLQLLADRNLTNQVQIDEFLNPDYSSDLHDPFLFQDMQKVVDRIFQAREKKEKIIIYGDYDADGVCGSAILAKVFQKLNISFETYLPDRESEGYGLNQKAVESFIKQKVNLIITVDCGISNKPEVQQAVENKLDVIITDHHHVPDELPPALAIIHPGYDTTYPFKNLAGGGVAFKVAQAILRSQKFAFEKSEAEAMEKWLLDLVAISTVADMVPLLGENRTLVKYGLMVLKKTKNLGLQELYKTASIKPESLDARTIGFHIAPRINAAGRMSHANSAYQLLVTENIEEAIKISSQLNKRNVERQSLTESLVNSAKKQIVEADPASPVLFVWGEGWNAGVIGLVASKITQEFCRPSFALSFDGQRYVASGRSIREFNLIEAMEEFKDYFIKFGGHAGAAGFSILPEKFEEFRQKFIEYADKKLAPEDFIPSLIIDKELTLKETDWQLVEILDKFEPFGWNNYQPRFLLNNLQIVLADTVGQNKNHLRLAVQQNGVARKIICFGFGNLCDQLQPGEIIDAVCEMGVNEWNGNREIQLSLVDIRKHSE